MLNAANTGSDGATDNLDLAARRLQWLNARQQVLATNVANSDTPGYESRDVASFSAQLSQFTVSPTVTDARHIASESEDGLGAVQIVPHERAPDGNAVSLQQQLTEIAGNDSDQRVAGNLYSKIMQMYSTALDK